MVSRWRAGVAITSLLALVACGNGPPDARRGQALFQGQANLGDASVPTCVTCHTVEPGEQADIGNNLSNIGNRAANTVVGQTADDYLRTAIVDPDAYLAGGFQEGIMYREYAKVLTKAQIDDLVAYMLTLQSGVDN